MRMTEIHQPDRDEQGFQVLYATPELQYMGPRILEEAMRLAATELARRYVDGHGQEILATIRPEAIATMATAEAGAEIHTLLQKKLPDKIERIVEREVYQRGIFGGLRRMR